MNKRGLIVSVLFASLFILILTFGSALESNESIVAAKTLQIAKATIDDMQSQNIPTLRVNEIYQETSQLYAAQLALENSKRVANYKLINENSQIILNLKSQAIKARDELLLFLQTYEDIKTNTNLSSMNALYNEIVDSYNKERFEDTPGLVEKGYTQLSELQSSQTATNLFYNALSNTLKNFLIRNWIKLTAIAIAIILILTIFWRTIRSMGIKLKIRNLETQKMTLSHLVKKIQLDYFKNGKISDVEYKTKLDKFKEMSRDIDRQLPLLRESLAKTNRGVVNPENKPSPKKKKK
ncbi:MAG: hypothetical protein WCK90_03265 [archaeon]